jgi:hypothetical protein
MQEDNFEQPIKSKASLRFEEIRKESESIKILAKWLLLIAGTIFSILSFDLLVSNYVFKDFTKETLEAFGTFAAGTSGVIIGASTIVFLIYNIRIQNASLLVSIEDVESSIKEMKDSNKQFSEQKSENLFFNLLDNHDKLINNYGTNNLNSYYSDELAKIKNYYNNVNLRAFNRKETLINNPFTSYSENKFIEKAVDSAIHIIEYIETKLNDTLFFHKTFHNSMNPCVKFFVGFVFEERFKQAKHEIPSLYFEEYHKQLSLLIVDNPYIPRIEINRDMSLSGVNLDVSTNFEKELYKVFRLTIVNHTDLRAKQTKYLGFKQIIKFDNETLNEDNFEDEKIIEGDCSIDINTGAYLNELIPNFISVAVPVMNGLNNLMKLGDKYIESDKTINFFLFYELKFSYPIIDEPETFIVRIWINIQLVPRTDIKAYQLNVSSFT